MKSRYGFALAIVASFLLGATGQCLHAQEAPPAYVVAEITVTDQDKYTKEFMPLAVDAIHAAGGEFLARGGKTESLKGAPPAPRIVVFIFESMDKAQEWWNSSARKDADAIGEKCAKFRVYVVEGALDTSQL
jgi:uncharacterized protein (DUF1330 family)